MASGGPWWGRWGEGLTGASPCPVPAPRCLPPSLKAVPLLARAGRPSVRGRVHTSPPAARPQALWAPGQALAPARWLPADPEHRQGPGPMAFSPPYPSSLSRGGTPPPPCSSRAVRRLSASVSRARATGRATHTPLATPCAAVREAEPLRSQRLPSGEGTHTEHTGRWRGQGRGGPGLCPCCSAGPGSRAGPAPRSPGTSAEQLISRRLLHHLGARRQPDGQTVSHVSGCPCRLVTSVPRAPHAGPGMPT